MQNTAWMALWRKIPPDKHDHLMVVTAVGTEIAVQNLLRIEEDFIVVRGRLAGSSDSGRVFFLPYSQIDYAGFQKPLREEEFDALFGESSASVPAPAPALPPVEPITPLPASKPQPTPHTNRGGTHTDQQPRNGNRPPLPLKSDLLERLRLRSAQGTAHRPPLEE
jgi:hypothetical protein